MNDATAGTPVPDYPTLDGRLEAQRKILFRAMGIVGTVRRVLEDSEQAQDGIDQNAAADAYTALASAYELLNEVAGDLDPARMLGEERP